ncbi:MAG: MBL fold metallo-hydrolase [Arthrobacter sp.]|uniref:MBL fold metallo-hydrolase n=1 Tax=Arthrobacter sp. TaxID=1667 RepID=UPI00347C9DCA
MTNDTTLLHDLARLTIRKTSVSDMDNNVYLLTSKETGAQVLIDAADDAPAIRSMLAESAGDSARPVRLALIATTHQHWDHIRALREMAEETGAPLAAGSEDADAIETGAGVRVDVRLDHGNLGNFDGFDLAAVHLRGHTPGSLAYVYRDPEGPAHIFSGDSLFPGGVGNTWKDPQRFSSLLRDVSERLFGVYADDTLVHPGHGGGTTLGAERPRLGEWEERGW